MKYSVKISIVLTILILSFAFFNKAFSAPQAKAVAESDELLMGKTMQLNISVPIPHDSARVELPILLKAELQKLKYVGLVNDTVELLVKHSRKLAGQGNDLRYDYNLTIQAFDSGKYKLPPFVFIVDGDTIQSNSVEVNVIPVKAKADDKIDGFTDVLPPFEVNPSPEEMEEEESSLLWWLIGAAILLALLILFLFWRYRRTGQLFSAVKPQPPYVVALRKLRKLQEQNLPSKGKTKEYYTRLTDILRTYLKRQFGIKTIEKTSEEILRYVKDDERISNYEPLLKSIFETADFVKFAKVNPSLVENSRCLTDAERFVKTSHPVEKEGGEK